jgi:hypothetical protein
VTLPRHIDVVNARQVSDLADLARPVVAAEEADHGQKLLDRVVTSLFEVGLSLQAAIGQPHYLARQGISDALQCLDETICQIRDHVRCP